MKNEKKKQTNFEHSKKTDVANKAYLDKNFSGVFEHQSCKERTFNHFKKHSNEKQPENEDLIEKAVETTLQLLYDKGLFDNYNNANEILKVYLLSEVKERR